MAFLLPMVVIFGPLGACIGYSITGILISLEYDWELSFIFLAWCMAVCFGILVLIPAKYLNLNEV